MNAKRVLIPLDLMTSPSDALVYAREMAVDAPLCVTLLYVLNLNIVAPGRQVYDELCAEGEAALRKLAWLFFGTERAARIVVRVGLPHEQIVAEARSDKSDLIILSSPKRRSWKRFLGLGTTQRIVDASPCPAMVLPQKSIRPPHRIIIPAPVEPETEEVAVTAA